MAAIDDAARRTRAAVDYYDALCEVRRNLASDDTLTPEGRGQVQAQCDLALIKVLGATEYLLSIITQERDTL